LSGCIEDLAIFLPGLFEDVLWCDEAVGHDDEDIGLFKAGLLVEGMVHAWSPKGIPVQGVGQGW
jgi:hypothetical protein